MEQPKEIGEQCSNVEVHDRWMRSTKNSEELCCYDCFNNLKYMLYQRLEADPQLHSSFSVLSLKTREKEIRPKMRKRNIRWIWQKQSSTSCLLPRIMLSPQTQIWKIHRRRHRAANPDLLAIWWSFPERSDEKFQSEEHCTKELSVGKQTNTKGNTIMVPTLQTIMNSSYYYEYRENIHLGVELTPAGIKPTRPFGLFTFVFEKVRVYNY